LPKYLVVTPGMSIMKPGVSLSGVHSISSACIATRPKALERSAGQG